MSRKIYSPNICWLVLLGISLVTISCNGKLSRSEAARLIPNDQKFSETKGGNITVGVPLGFLTPNENVKLNKVLVSLNYIEYRDQGGYDGVINLTDKGQKEAVNWKKYNTVGIYSYTVPYAKREIIEVTGISEPKSDDNLAQAKFTWRWQPANEIGRAMDKSEFEQNYDGEATLQKYDDGWRVVKVSGRGILDSF